MKKIPKHIVEIWGSARSFKAEKRRQLDGALRALGNYRQGCANAPAYGKIKKAHRLLAEAREELSVKSWGR